MILVIATSNAHKLDEYRTLLPGIPLRALSDWPDAPDPVEDAPDFVGNAIIKAKSAHAHTGLPCLADDSGIGVAYLDWAPGVRSARYAPGSDLDRRLALLQATSGVVDRRARFTCAIAIAGLPSDLEFPANITRRSGCIIAQGVVEGALTQAPRGQHGFGYDPIFELPDGRTAAELTPAEKHQISHRANATFGLHAPLLSFFS